MYQTSQGNLNGSDSICGLLTSASKRNSFEQTLQFLQQDLRSNELSNTNNINNNNNNNNNNNDRRDSFGFDEICALIESSEFQDNTLLGRSNIISNRNDDINNNDSINNNKPIFEFKPNQADTNNLLNLQGSVKTYNNLNQYDSYIPTLEPSHLSCQQAEVNSMRTNMENPVMNRVPGVKNQFVELCDPFAAIVGETSTSAKPYVEIVEQPARCALRFRYKCEGRSAGSLPGTNSTSDNKTFPAIRIQNYRGRAVVVVSCVTKEEPYRAHPHNIVGREGCKKGICTIVISNNDPTTARSFTSLGIQCVKRKDIEESLTLRESINVDPFRKGFDHKLNSSNIDLNAVRLCFQVFIEGNTTGKCDVPLMPVVSDPIHDKKAMSDLVITKLSHCSAPATGGREVILLCDRIARDDITIRFYEERDGKLIWETYYEPSCTDIHKQVAICFKTPKYYNENIQRPVMTRIQLKRISDGQVSEPRQFQFLPCESDEDIILRKRQKIDWVNSNRFALNNILQAPMQNGPMPQQHPQQYHQPVQSTANHIQHPQAIQQSNDHQQQIAQSYQDHVQQNDNGWRLPPQP